MAYSLGLASPLLLCCFLSGCVSLDSIVAWPARFSSVSNDKTSLTQEFNLNVPTERQAFISSIDQESRQLEVSAARLGSLVGVCDEDGHQFHGILFQKNDHSIVVMNCICKQPVPGPRGQKQCQTSHVPFQAFDHRRLQRFGVYDAPIPQLKTHEIRYDSPSVTVDALVFMSGRRMQWTNWPDSSERAVTPMSPVEIQREIATTTPGSQVCLTDEFDQSLHGILLKADKENIELMNCIWKEVVPGSDGQTQIRTIHLPLRSLEISSLRAYQIDSPPLPELASTELGLDSRELAVNEFAYLSDRH